MEGDISVLLPSFLSGDFEYNNRVSEWCKGTFIFITRREYLLREKSRIVVTKLCLGEKCATCVCIVMECDVRVEYRVSSSVCDVGNIVR